MSSLKRSAGTTRNLCTQGGKLLLFVAALPSTALAESAGLETLWLPFFNFTLYAILLVWLYKRYGTGLVRQRALEIKEQVASAASALAEAERKLEVVQARLSEIDAEKALVVKRYEDEGAAMSRTIVANARKQAERIAADSKRQIDSELQQAKKMLRNEAVDRATEIARRRIGSELSPEQDRLLRKAVVQEFTSQENK